MDIKTLKTQLDIYQVAERLNIPINKQYRANCPFHHDKTPSLQFSKEKQIATCFSSNCNAGTMDVINLTEKKLSLSTHEAIKWLETEFNLQQGSTPVVGEPQKPAPVNYAKLFKVFEANLKKSSKGKAYLKERGLSESLEVGYNGTAWEKMKHCIIFPLKNKKGEITSLYGRSTVNNAQSKHYYNSNRTGLYPGYPSPDTETLILTESVIDAATLSTYAKAAVDNANTAVLALYGTNGLTDEHLEAIKSLPGLKEIILFFDGDQAGRAAIEKHTKILSSIASAKEDFNDTRQP